MLFHNVDSLFRLPGLHLGGLGRAPLAFGSRRAAELLRTLPRKEQNKQNNQKEQKDQEEKEKEKIYGSFYFVLLSGNDPFRRANGAMN